MASFFTRAAPIARVCRGCAMCAGIPISSSRSASHPQPQVASKTASAGLSMRLKASSTEARSLATVRWEITVPAASMATIRDVLR